MRVVPKIATTLIGAVLSACSTLSASALPEGQDISFIGGCWEQHDGANADFLRLLRDQQHPGGFVGDQLKIRDGEIVDTSRWTFAPGGTAAEWASATAPADEYSVYTFAPDRAAEDRAAPRSASAAFFGDRPGGLYLRVQREDDRLLISRQRAHGSDIRYVSANDVLFEGRLSGCD